MPGRGPFCACGCKKRVSFKGNFKQGHAPQGQSTDPLGQKKALNDKLNPISKKKRKDERRADAESFLAARGRTGILSTPTRAAIADGIATDRSLFDNHHDERLRGKSLDDLFADPSFSGYIGETLRTLELEALRWLTARGSQLHVSGRNRPVLAFAPEETGGEPVLIKMSEAKEQLGFDAVFLWKNEEKPNTTFVEDRLQQRYHHLGLPRRLHRRVGMGDNGFGAEDEEGATELHKVFLAYSFDVQGAIDTGKVVVVH